MVIFRHTVTVTESSPLVSAGRALPAYARAKLAIYYDGMHRVCRGEFTEYASFPLSWPYVEDAVRIALAALDSLAGFCNLGCAAAGVAHRVRDVPLANLTSDIGEMRALAGVRYPTPLVDPSRTSKELGITLTPVRTGVEKTVAWLHDQRKI